MWTATNWTGRSSWLLESIVGSPTGSGTGRVLGHREVTVAVDLLMYLAADAVAQVLVQPEVGFRVGTCSSASRGRRIESATVFTPTRPRRGRRGCAASRRSIRPCRGCHR